MDLEVGKMTSLMDYVNDVTAGLITFCSVGLTLGWHSSNHEPNNWNHPAILNDESDVIMDQTAFVFLVFDWGSGPETQSRTELSWGLSLWPSSYWAVSPTTSPPYCFTTYLPQHNFDSTSRFPFTQGWPTVVLPLKAHVQPKSAPCLGMNFVHGFGDQTSIFIWDFHSTCFSPNQSCVVVITDLTTLDWQFSSERSGHSESKLMSIINIAYPIFTCSNAHTYTL